MRRCLLSVLLALLALAARTTAEPPPDEAEIRDVQVRQAAA